MKERTFNNNICNVYVYIERKVNDCKANILMFYVPGGHESLF